MPVEPWQRGGFGLYVHWPFCEAKCPYCDFNSHVTASIDQRRWADALAAEVRRWAEVTPGRVLSSIFFGGGTPSLMTPETVDTVLRAAQDSWTWANDIEITLEANPRSVEAARFRGFAEAGVNRVSLGVQSLREGDLRRLGRLHDVDEARAAFDIARKTFDRVSFDLIYARQGQTREAWRDELSEALDMAADHLSLYQLTIEPGTAFWDRRQAGGLRGLPDEDLGADLFEMTQDICGAAGMPAYEVSNHTRPGAESRHNLVYWRSGDWVGVGPGAHGRVTMDGARRSNAGWLAPGKWLGAAEAGNGDESIEVLTDEDRDAEYLMMGLRLTEGLDVDGLGAVAKDPRFHRSIDELIAQDLLWARDESIGATARGRLLLNAVIAELMPD
ncbi:oxygen-independent coproporphyrinogen-3 oxidase [Citreimonas salinaria]|uniref:Heme chaperone HemW n=1 Tax=Citreimonas salinaria TaxID=321339 RepID=A0A1H3FCG2_9RHOB|nr:oxygen-independent coproporphyrinogen-3 oxidase [Citreimonas salinaria]